ncbi:MAG: RpiB/LacA/LacB family sugar-phosphate isomerase [Alphaproteobacteria bacterium]
MKRIIVGADHLGLQLKDALVAHLRQQGWTVEDIGVHSEDPVDYPDIALTLATRIASGEFGRGVLVCGTGAGMAITANKVPGVRAVAVNDPYTAERAIASNNAQVICFGQRVTGEYPAIMYLDIWLANEFQAERSGKKVAKIDAVEDRFRPAAE